MDFDEATLPSTLTVEVDGKPVPLRDTPFVKEAKDIGSLIKGGYDAHREVGARFRLPDKTKADEVGAFKGKLIEAGILEAPVKGPDEYEIKKPDSLPEGLTWDEGLVTEFKQTMHKMGVPKSAAQALIDLHLKAMGTMTDGLLGAMDMKTDEAKTEALLKTEFGDKYDTLRADAGRLAGEIFKTPEELAFFEKLGLGNHPKFLSILMRLAPLASQDSSFMPDATRPGTAPSQETLRAELADIQTNPKNERYEGYKRGDKAVMDYIDQQYQKVYGSGKVTLA